jgi:hypothetical protein
MDFKCSAGLHTAINDESLKGVKEVHHESRHFFTGIGPILLLTSYPSFQDPNFIGKLMQKGIKKFIAYEVSDAEVKKKYGNHYNVILGDLKQTDDLRVLDYDGHHVFYNFSIKALRDPIYHES